MPLTHDTIATVLTLAGNDPLGADDLAELHAAHPTASPADLAEAVAGWPLGSFTVETTVAINDLVNH